MTHGRLVLWCSSFPMSYLEADLVSKGYTIPRKWENRLGGGAEENASRALQSLGISQGLPKPVSHYGHKD